MEAMLAYLLKVSVAAVLLYLFIRILMERETQHEYIRVLWLAAIVVPLVLPFIYVPVPDIFPGSTEAAGNVNIIMSAENTEMLPPEDTAAATDWSGILGYIYISGAAAVFAMYAVSHIRLHVRLGRYPLTHEYDTLLCQCARESGCSRKARLHLAEDSSTIPYSWMRDIVISRRDLESDGRDIILHEMGHISRGHSWDIIVTELFTCILWFNPVSWLIQNSLRRTHEYSADSTVLRSGADAREYQTLLIRKAVGQACHSIANSFNHSNLKKRITMMSQNQTSKRAYAKSLALLPVLACLLFVFSASRPAPSDKVNEISADTEIAGNPVEVPVEVTDTVRRQKSTFAVAVGTDNGTDIETYVAVQTENGNPILFKDVEEKPLFNGKDLSEFARWICENLVYPEEARKDGVGGRVIIQFVISEDGSVTDAEVLRGVHPALDEAAVNAVKASPKWTPGKVNGKAVKVKFVFPVLFQEFSRPSEI